MKTERVDMGVVTVLRMEGDIDEGGVKDLRNALLNCLKDQRYNVIVNVENVNFISYMGIGVLVERLRQFRSYEGDLRLVGLNMYMQRMFRMGGITNLFEIYETEAQAVQEYQKAA